MLEVMMGAAPEAMKARVDTSVDIIEAESAGAGTDMETDWWK